MASIVSAGTTSATSLNLSADTSGVLQLASNNGTVGLTLDTSQRVLLGTTASGSSLVQATQAGINAASLTTTTVKNLGVKLGFTGVSNTNGYIFGGVAMGGNGEEYAGIAAYDNGSSAATGLKLFTGTTSAIVEAVNIDSAGRVTMPYQPSFLVKGTSYTQTSGGASKIIPGSEVFDIGSNYDLANGRFTAPVSGVYLFGFFGLSYPQDATEVSSLQYQKNGSAYGDNMQFGGGSSSHQGVAGGITVNMSANDYVELFYTSAAGTASKAYGSQWNMYGYLIG